MIPKPASVRLTGLVGLFSLLGACGSRAQTASESPPATAVDNPRPSMPASPDSLRLPEWMSVDSTARSVSLDLVVTSPPGAQSALINGYRAGEIRLNVPLGWTVRWNWRSTDSTAPHSLVVMVEREKIPLEGGRPAFSNAMTRMVTEGLKPGETDQTTFQAEEAGWFWLLCGVPSHAIKGEWISLKVDRAAKQPSVVVKKKA